MKKLFHLFLTVVALQYAVSSCDGQKTNMTKENPAAEKQGDKVQKQDQKKFTEGSDYIIYERVRMLDKTAFTTPQEAYSLLLPKGWGHEDEIIWNGPGTSCAGTFKRLKARSADGNYELEMLPDMLYMWNTNTEMMQFYQNNGGSSSNCTAREPMNAEQYLRNVFAGELGNPEIRKVEPNQNVVDQMKQMNEKTMSELRQYGAGQMQFYQTAVNADVHWPGGSDGWIVLGVSVLETVVPNVYNGTYSKIFTTQITKRTVFKYPAAEKEQAKIKFGAIMSSFRSNPAWNDAVMKFWKDVREKKHVAHVGKIQMMDEQTRQMGEQAIRSGQERLKNMDSQMRSWEQRQSSQDRMHTEFIKTIRGVENYRDETGKYEMASGYDHAWSRGDGNSFVLSNNPNFDPAFVFKDQNWKEMKKVQ
jgi:hypothetical protein